MLHARFVLYLLAPNLPLPSLLLGSVQCTLKMMMTTMPQTNSTATRSQTAGEMGMPQQQQQPGPVNCPRCDSTNTKFCYYNNYSLTQPRHFCKACKRYWTRGGTLRNVPVGGGYRKNKRAKKPSPAPSAASNPPPAISVNPPRLSAELNPFLYADISNLPLPLGLRFNNHHSLFDSSLFSATSATYEDIRTMGSGDLGVQKEAKVEAEANADGYDAIDWRLQCENPYEALAAAESGESQFFYWNGTVGSAWPDANNCGSSMASLI